MLARHGLTLDPLPHGVSLSRIYSDFLGYLLHHTKTYFEDRILDGKSIWEQYSPAMEIGRRHRRVLDPGPGVEKNFVRDVLRPGMNFAICEADDSIVKSTLYSVISMRPTVKLREQRATVCTQAGSAFVGLEAEKFLRKSLENIGLPVDRVVDYTRAGVEDFRRITARLFMDEASTYSIAFAPISFNNPAINTRRGRMMVPGVTIKGFFDVYVKQIMESVDQQLDFNAARRALLEIVLTYVKSFESVTNHKDVELSSQMTPRPKRLQKGQLFGKSHMGAQTALCNSHGV
ncbi:unnamed protein product [Rhizoctonia solani]|uniref:Uncharacterized protein n=1 Tax=Rhizoctonia solani TaxID=456999 RepID=A0A8H3C9U5_9AGAM|nr:unnamed protein product [Rhizoctonia solani]